MADNIVPFLPAALERQVRSLLDTARVYDVDSYGWLNENDPDPTFIGHAMWQVDHPSIDHEALLGERPVRLRPAEMEKLILTIGEDFTGLMQASRLSIGLALLWQRPARVHPVGDSPFHWLHHTDSFLKLAIASDRLRDLLIVACTGAAASLYRSGAKQNKLFVTPFKQAEALLEGRGLREARLTGPTAVLPLYGVKIFDFIKRRNAIVHDVATRMAKFMRESGSELQERFDREQVQGFTPTPMPADEAEWRSAEARRAHELHSEIDGALQEVIDWYHLLIRASNAVFEVEYWSRRLVP